MHFVRKLSLNVVPLPSLLFVSIDPPICWTIYLQIERPRPVPCLFLYEFSLSVPKLINKLSTPSLEMPIPVSWIERLKHIKHSSPTLISDILFYFLVNFSTIFTNDMLELMHFLFFMNWFISFGIILSWIFWMSIILICIIMSPSLSVNFTAFEIKFKIIYKNRRLSPQI